MSSSKSSKGERTVVHGRDGKITSRDSSGRDPNPPRDIKSERFPANRSLRQGELPKR